MPMVHFIDTKTNETYYIGFDTYESAEEWRSQLLDEIKDNGVVSKSVVNEATGKRVDLLIDGSIQHIAFKHDPS